MPTRFLTLGGFLGAGKTTAILRLAQRMAARGRRVGVIANDLGEGLVDTETYRAHGLPVEELPGGCFACKFDALLAAAGRLADGDAPDVLIAEPAGSCTDLVAKVIAPLRALYADRFEVAPYAALLDPLRARAALGGEATSLSARVMNLFLMQQHEASVIAINKCDLLSERQRAEMELLARRNFASARILAVSARTGEGFDALERVLDAGASIRAPRTPQQSAMTAAEESEPGLAWVHALLKIEGDEPMDCALLAERALREAQSRLAIAGAPPAHVKLLLRRDGAALARGSLVDASVAPEVEAMAGETPRQVELLVNARVEGAPAGVRDAIEAAIRAACEDAALRCAAGQWSCLSADPATAGCTARAESLEGM